MAAQADHEPNELDVRVGAMIRARRKEIGVTQEALAEACGVTFQQIQKYERAANRISFSRLVQIAQALRISPAWFFEGLEQDVEDPAGARKVTAFFSSAEGLTIAQAATKLEPRVRRAIADFARTLAEAA